MFQGKTLFNKTMRGSSSNASESQCKSCGGDLYTHRG